METKKKKKKKEKKRKKGEKSYALCRSPNPTRPLLQKKRRSTCGLTSLLAKLVRMRADSRAITARSSALVLQLRTACAKKEQGEKTNQQKQKKTKDKKKLKKKKKKRFESTDLDKFSKTNRRHPETRPTSPQQSWKPGTMDGVLFGRSSNSSIIEGFLVLFGLCLFVFVSPECLVLLLWCRRTATLSWSSTTAPMWWICWLLALQGLPFRRGTRPPERRCCCTGTRTDSASRAAIRWSCASQCEDGRRRSRTSYKKCTCSRMIPCPAKTLHSKTS